MSGALQHINRSYALAVAAVLLLSTGVAVFFGFVSSDSWEYLHLAQSLRDGNGCSLRGAYFAVLPCGYPLVIALTAPSADLATLLVSSKFVNLALLAAAFVMLAKTHRNLLLPALIVVNPITLAIAQYTWSENLFLFALCGALFAVSRIACQPARRAPVVWLALFLLTGCAARYFFGPFAALLFVGIWLIHGRALALRTFPAFVVAGLFFLAYQWFNAQMTGYASGMPRVAAPESLLYLTLRFINSAAHIAVFFALSLALLLALSARYWTFSRPPLGEKNNDESRRALLLAWSGAAFLLLAFATRATTHFDMFGTRTIGYGLVLAVAGALGLLLRPTGEHFPALAIVAAGLVAMLAGHGGELPRQMASAWAGGYPSVFSALRAYRLPAGDADLVVTLGTPSVMPLVASDSRLYYPAGTRVVWFFSAPFRQAESLAEFKARALSAQFRSCRIDFTPFADQAAIERYVDRSYVVDVRYDADSRRLVELTRPAFDPSIRAYLLGKFEPGRRVACDELAAR